MNKEGVLRPYIGAHLPNRFKERQTFYVTYSSSNFN